MVIIIGKILEPYNKIIEFSPLQQFQCICGYVKKIYITSLHNRVSMSGSRTVIQQILIPGIIVNSWDIPGISIFSKNKFFGVIGEICSNNFHENVKQMIDVFYSPRNSQNTGRWRKKTSGFSFWSRIGSSIRVL